MENKNLRDLTLRELLLQQKIELESPVDTNIVIENGEGEAIEKMIRSILEEAGLIQTEENINRLIKSLRKAGLLDAKKLTSLGHTPISRWTDLLGKSHSLYTDRSENTFNQLCAIAAYYNLELRRIRQSLLEYLKLNNLKATPIFTAYSDRPEMLEVLFTIKPKNQEEFIPCCSLVQYLVREEIPIGQIQHIVDKSPESYTAIAIHYINKKGENTTAILNAEVMASTLVSYYEIKHLQILKDTQDILIKLLTSSMIMRNF
ncbi:MAG: hypothetical protein WCK98_05950 [bacterium]